MSPSFTMDSLTLLGIMNVVSRNMILY